MGKPAARMGDLTAHGGTIVLGLPTVLIGKMPASTLGDMHVCPMCTGPVPHVGGPIILGSMGVLVGKKPAARISDQAVCVGPPSMNAMGCFTVLIGEAGSGSQAGAAEAAAAAAAAGKTGPKAIKPFPLSEPPAAPPKVHSVDFEFLDSAGKPLGGIPFTLKDPDGKLIVGASSMDGKGSYSGYVKEGSFTVTIPVLSEAKWDKAEIAASESCGWSVKADAFDEGAQAWVSVYGTGEGGLRIMVVTEEKKVQGGKVSGTWDAKASLLSEAGHKPELETCETFQIMVCVGTCVAVSPSLKVHDTVEIVLTGDAGKPRKDMPYTLTLRDGAVLKGKLDGQGKAKHEKVIRGKFQVVFGDTKVGVGEQKPAADNGLKATADKDRPAVPEKEQEPHGGSGKGDLKEVETTNEICKEVKELDHLAINKIIHETVIIESGSKAYSAINCDFEFEGYFDLPKNWYKKHGAKPQQARPISQDPNIRQSKYFSTPEHVGLSYGIVQFTQQGPLGELLHKMKIKDEGKFREVFGEYSETLLEITAKKGPPSKFEEEVFDNCGVSMGNKKVNRKPSLMKVGGKDLWEKYWVEKFELAATHPAFQAAQNELVYENYFKPVVNYLKSIGLEPISEKSLAILFDRKIQQGNSKKYCDSLKINRKDQKGFWKKEAARIGGDIKNRIEMISESDRLSWEICYRLS